MRFVSVDWARAWAARHEGLLDSEGRPHARSSGRIWDHVQIERLPAVRLHSFARELVEALGYWDKAILWPTDFGPNGQENLHAYYRCRTSYGDIQLMAESPCQVFESFEKADLLTFVELVISNGWSAHVITSHDYGRLWLSASHYVEVGVQGDAELRAFRDGLTRGEFSL